MGRELIEDGFGSCWEKCDSPTCSLQVVRPGKAQCNYEQVEGEFGPQWVEPCVYDTIGEML